MIRGSLKKNCTFFFTGQTRDVHQSFENALHRIFGGPAIERRAQSQATRSIGSRRQQFSSNVCKDRSIGSSPSESIYQIYQISSSISHDK